MKEKQIFMEEFNNKLHRLGRITLVLSVIFLIALPFVFGAIFGVSPDLKAFLSGNVSEILFTKIYNFQHSTLFPVCPQS